jgi:hypothetical protein
MKTDQILLYIKDQRKKESRAIKELLEANKLEFLK